MGEKGIAMLMSPDLLLSGAFSRATDIEQVPAWRDGARGQELQRRMVGVAAKMYFEYGFAKSTKPLFASAATWVAFTRLLNFLEVCHECSQRQCATTRTHTYANADTHTCTHWHRLKRVRVIAWLRD